MTLISLPSLLQKDDVYHQVFSDKIPLYEFFSHLYINPVFKQHLQALRINLCFSDIPVQQWFHEAERMAKVANLYRTK